MYIRNFTFFVTILLSVTLTTFGQQKKKTVENKNAIENIQKVLDDYIEYQESTDSQHNKDLMFKSLESLRKVTRKKDFEILLNVWMYYDPTDFPCRDMVFNILNNNKPESINAIKRRMITKKARESDEIAPFSELKDLLNELDNNFDKTLKLLQGNWYHDQDSLSAVTISGNVWTFKYKREQPDSTDIYKISFSKQLPKYVKEVENAEFLILTNTLNTLDYEILGISDSTFSLMYFPAGRIHLYRRQK